MRATEFGAVRAVLGAAGLPVDDLDGSAAVRFWVAAVDTDIHGVIGLESAGGCALLRSLAVVPAERHRRLGRALVARVESEARTAGFGELTLLTVTAQGFFEALGFEAIERTRVPAGVQQTAEFRSLCPATAVCLRKPLGTNGRPQ
ncbi:MAG: GNAT family N-acetyltransferase [Proteobacteria bacterium]|nr:GNAT family N-acetyltransferase [Pseudomonadota bacterium]